MEIFCTRPGCARPVNRFPDLDNRQTLKTVPQKFCMTCGMPLILGGRYLPQKPLGQGGFGTAFLAQDRYTPNLRSCVVKLFQPAGQLTPGQLQVARDLFDQEAIVLEKLGNRHPQIPDLYAFFPLQVPSTQPGHPEEYFYLVQEFIDGQNLEELLDQKGAFAEAEVREVLVALLKILEFVHQNGAIHRDIKPSNIMRDRQGVFYLLDFGAVKQIAQGVGSPGSHSTGIFSAGYAPPEQMAGSAIYPSTDLYALAVTCITLLTGKPPQELYDSYRNIWNWQPQAPQVSAQLARVLNRMLAAAPEQRYGGAAEVLRALATPSSQGTPTPGPVPQSSPHPARSATHRSPGAAPSPKAPPSASTSLQKPPLPAPPAAAPQPPASPRPFSLIRFLGGAAFTGFEGGLLAIASFSLFGMTWLGSGTWLLLLGGMIWLQLKRVIERVDLVIIAAVSLGVVLGFPSLHAMLPVIGNRWQVILVIGGLGAGIGMAIAILYRLLYRLFRALL